MNSSDGLEQARENLQDWLEEIISTEVEDENLTKAYFDIIHLSKKCDQYLKLFEIYQGAQRETNMEISIDDEGTVSFKKRGKIWNNDEEPESNPSYIG